MSVDQESALNLDSDEVAVAAFLAENGGHLVRDDQLEGGGDRAVYWITFRPRSVPTESYIARIEWFAYPYQEPSIKFADGIRGSLTLTRAWPMMDGYRPGSFDICRPMCREGYAVHPEWRQGSTAWPTDGNPFLWVVQTMQYHFDNIYQARSA
ncbi:MAG: hypothetical protein ACLQRH_15135 [Acidimicrobiales bacterium]